MSQPLQVGKTLRNHYKIVQLLGSGGFGNTYLAVDLDLPGQPQCVVKHLKSQDLNPAVLPTAKNLFDREAQFLYQLGNENNQIPKLFAHFEEDGEFFLVQEFVDGHDLTQEIAPGKRLRERDVFNLLKDILEVLAIVHQYNVIHRDIKPQNLMRRRKDGKIVLIDFGAVKEIGVLEVNPQGQTGLTVAVGSPGYMPPEQALGRPRLSSDIYAAGMLSIQALTGLKPRELPINSDTEEIVWRNFAQVSSSLADVLDIMVRHHVSQRYQSAAAALQALIPIEASLSPSSAAFTTDSTVALPPSSPVSSIPIQSTAIPVVLEEIIPSQPLAENYLSESQPVISSPPRLQKKSRSRRKSRSRKKPRSLIGVSCAGFLVLVLTFFFFLTKMPLSCVLDSLPISPAWDLYRKGLDKYKKGDYQGAVEDYNQALKLDPYYVPAYNKRGLAHSKLGDQKQAIKDYTLAIEINPYDVHSYYKRGIAQSKLGDHKGAIKDYTQAIKINSDDALTYSHRGLAYASLGDYKKAIEDYIQAIKINPGDAFTYDHLGSARFKLGDKNGAINDYQKAASLYQKQGKLEDKKSYQSILDKLKKIQK